MPGPLRSPRKSTAPPQTKSPKQIATAASRCPRAINTIKTITLSHGPMAGQRQAHVSSRPRGAPLSSRPRAAVLPLPVLHGERVMAELCLRHEVRGGCLLQCGSVAAPHPNPLPSEEWEREHAPYSNPTVARSRHCSAAACAFVRSARESLASIFSSAGSSMPPALAMKFHFAASMRLCSTPAPWA
jgi:hypothetical protein